MALCERRKYQHFVIIGLKQKKANSNKKLYLLHCYSLTGYFIKCPIGHKNTIIFSFIVQVLPTGAVPVLQQILYLYIRIRLAPFLEHKLIIKSLMKSLRKHRQHVTDDISGTSQWQCIMICIFMSTLVCLCHCPDLIIIYSAAAAVSAEMYAASRRDTVILPHIPASSHPFTTLYFTYACSNS